MDTIFDLMKLGQTAIFVVWFILALCFVNLVYNCLFHPLANVPGPFLAKLTRLWLFKVDVSGRGSRRIRELHERYGPIVRIAPNEVSLSPLSAYNDIYGQKTKFLKDPEFYGQILPGGVVSLFTISDPALHSSLKRLFSNAFSRTNILLFQDAMNEHVDLAVAQVRKHIELDKPLPLYLLATSYTTDTISRLSFGANVGALERDDLEHPFVDALLSQTRSSRAWACAHYGFLSKVYNMLQIADLSKFLRLISECVMKAEGEGDYSEMKSLVHDASRRAKASNYDLSLKDKVSILLQFVGAGIGTTAISITGTLQRIYRHPEIRERLLNELQAAFPSKDKPISAQELEKLPFFQACIKEGIRVSCPAPRRLARLVPEEGYTFESYNLPAGVKISSSNFMRCYDPDYFPEPEKFNPDRWLCEDVSMLNASWLPFSKGPRGCIGQHMSVVEMELFVARFIRNFEVVEFVDEFDMTEGILAESNNAMLMKIGEISE